MSDKNPQSSLEKIALGKTEEKRGVIQSEVLEVKKIETVIAEKEQELKRRLNQRVVCKGSQHFLLGPSDRTLKH